MRCFAFWLPLLLALPLCAQVQGESPAPARTYNLLRENDTWSFLAETLTTWNCGRDSSFE